MYNESLRNSTNQRMERQQIKRDMENVEFEVVLNSFLNIWISNEIPWYSSREFAVKMNSINTVHNGSLCFDAALRNSQVTVKIFLSEHLNSIEAGGRPCPI